MLLDVQMAGKLNDVGLMAIPVSESNEMPAETTIGKTVLRPVTGDIADASPLKCGLPRSHPAPPSRERGHWEYPRLARSLFRTYNFLARSRRQDRTPVCSAPPP